MTTIAERTDTGVRAGRIDLSWPILIAFAAILCVLIILPMSWLVYFSLVDRTGALTLDNFRKLVTDPVFVDPLITTVIIATSSSIACCLLAAPMGWLVARTDMPLRRTVRALVTASFVTPPFLGAIAWELLAAPNSGLLNQAYRALTGAAAGRTLFNIYSLGGLIFVISCYTFPYVFVLVANALDRIPGELEDASSILGGRAWTTARRVTIPLALPALLAGALVAFLQAMTLFGSPAILALPAGFHTMTTKIWSLFQYPPKPELAAAASLPLLVLTVALLARRARDPRPARLFGGRRQAGRSAAGASRRVQMGGARRSPSWCCSTRCSCPISRCSTLRSRASPPQLVTLQQRHAAQHRLRVLRVLGHPARAVEHVHSRRRCQRRSGRPSRWSSAISRRARRSPGIARSASWRPRRSRCPASCSASACSSATRARPSCYTARCGSCSSRS